MVRKLPAKASSWRSALTLYCGIASAPRGRRRGHQGPSRRPAAGSAVSVRVSLRGCVSVTSGATLHSYEWMLWRWVANFSAEWDAHIAATGKAAPARPNGDATIADLKKRLVKNTQESTLLENKLKSAQTAIAALYHDNVALRQQLKRDVSAAVTPIRPRGPRRHR
ncbi:hypothetical protein [Streptomyces sp. NPDC093097]|uniref:hypothetical protein n=1 Tax=Streptomyces sp. NPDC093097 TaxID=3366027 RepID=UPI00380457F9